jgi:hypothetical protein
MAEAYTWPEGSVSLWTGSATASAVVAYAQNTDLMLARGWENRRTLSGNYYDIPVGYRADINIGAVFTSDGTLQRMFDSATAVHMKFQHTNAPNGSAGLMLYSGRIDALAYRGSENAPYTYTLTYHANQWSAY